MAAACNTRNQSCVTLTIRVSDGYRLRRAQLIALQKLIDQAGGGR